MTALLLVFAGLLAAWQPVETHSSTAVVLAGVALLLVPWGWKKTSAEGFRWVISLVAFWTLFVILGQAGGWDRTEAFAQVFLFGAVGMTVWLASRQIPDTSLIDIFVLGLVGLAVWGLWQSLGGLDHLRGFTESLPVHLRAGALARIDRGRAFASMLLPSHLAVVLATTLPILMVRIKKNLQGVAFAFAFAIGAVGIVATRSPVGVVLAIASCSLVLFFRQRKSFFWAVGVGVMVVAGVIGFRPDVLQNEPVVLRIDNWGSALWVWSKAPVVGVGLGGFGQAAQSIPWPVGNHPVHAHSLPLEWLADLGLFGLVSWILLTLGFVGVVRRLWRIRPEMAAALLVIPVHNLVDFSLYTTGVALPWAVLLGWSLALTRQDEEIREPVSPALRWIGVLAATGAVGVAILSLSGTVLVEAARGGGAPFQTRQDWASQAAFLAPWSGDAVECIGALALESGNPAMAREALFFLENRRWQCPRSAARAQLMGRLAFLAGDEVTGLENLWRAKVAQPYDERRRRDFETASSRLENELNGPR